MAITRNTVVKLDKWSNQTPYQFRETGVYGRVEAITSYQASDGKTYDAYTLGTIESTEDGYRIRPCGYTYYVPAYVVVEIMGQWNPSRCDIE